MNSQKNKRKTVTDLRKNVDTLVVSIYCPSTMFIVATFLQMWQIRKIKIITLNPDEVAQPSVSEVNTELRAIASNDSLKLPVMAVEEIEVTFIFFVIVIFRSMLYFFKSYNTVNCVFFLCLLC